jgi:integrase
MLACLLERATRKAGLATGRKPRHAGPHFFRHTFCSHLSMRGAPARAVQKLAGHPDLGTTQRYMHFESARDRNRDSTAGIAAFRRRAGQPVGNARSWREVSDTKEKG